MESSFYFIQVSIPLLLLLLSIIIHLRKPATRRRPPGPTNLPIIGAAHRILRPEPAHVTLRDLSAVHGPVMYFRLGQIPTVVISSAEAAREISKTHDLHFASRSVTNSVKIVTKNFNDMTFAPYGAFWRQMRRICVLSLLSPKRTRSFRAVRAEELLRFLRSIDPTCAVNVSERVARLTNKITVRAAIGDDSKIDHKLFLAALDEVKRAVSGFCVADLFPSAPFLATLTGFSGRLRRCQGVGEEMMDVIMEEHREKAARNKSAGGEDGDEDLLDVLLRCQRDETLPVPISDDHVKCVINDIFAGGSETAASVVEWAMSELIRSPKAMKRAQTEVREVLSEVYGESKKKMEEAEDLITSGKLSYLQLVIKETLRLHPSLPLLLPRECRKTSMVMDYEILKRDRVILNVWAIGRDPKYWEEPDTFKPERFENSTRDFNGADFEFLPFGAGRRMCPGMQFGLVMVELILANLLYHFDWEYLMVHGRELDMSENSGVTVGRKFPLCLSAIQRFPLPKV